MEETESKVTETLANTYQEPQEENEEAILKHPLHSEKEPECTDKEESKEKGNVPPEEQYGRGLRNKNLRKEESNTRCREKKRCL